MKILKTDLFLERRQSLGKLCKDGLVVLFANSSCRRNNTINFPYRQDSNFYYLTGFTEEQSVLMLIPNCSKSGTHRSILFVKEKDPPMEQWSGDTLGPEGTKRIFSFDEVYPYSTWQQKFVEFISGIDCIYYPIGGEYSRDTQLFSLIDKTRKSNRRSERGFPQIIDPCPIIGELRLYKDSSEIELMKKAGQISAAAHIKAITKCKPSMLEYELRAILEKELYAEGCARLAYESIVASGRNATVLHHTACRSVIRDGDLVLIDAAGEYQYYASDITRTFPVSQKFTKYQADIYDVVLNAQKEVIRNALPGRNLIELHQIAKDFLIEGLLQRKILASKNKSEFERIYFHPTSHWIGLDVHDVGFYLKDGAPRKLAQGMTFTVEPGLYFRDVSSTVSSKYNDIGIRIEDEVLITASGNIVLTKTVPKEREEIESLRNDSNSCVQIND